MSLSCIVALALGIAACIGQYDGVLASVCGCWCWVMGDCCWCAWLGVVVWGGAGLWLGNHHFVQNDAFKILSPFLTICQFHENYIFKILSLS